MIRAKAVLKIRPAKAISYGQFSAITQESNEKPIAFLERLKESL